MLKVWSGNRLKCYRGEVMSEERGQERRASLNICLGQVLHYNQGDRASFFVSDRPLHKIPSSSVCVEL